MKNRRKQGRKNVIIKKKHTDNIRNGQSLLNCHITPPAGVLDFAYGLRYSI